MESAEHGQAGLRPRFPALDPEPPPRPWWHAVLALLAVIVLGAAVFGILTRSPQRSVPTMRASGLSGLVLAETSDGLLTLTDLRSGRVLRLSALGLFPTNPPPVVSADGKYLMAPVLGKVVSLANPVAPVQVRAAITFSANNNPTLLSPFADHDGSIVIQQTIFFVPPAAARTSVQSLRTGHAVALGLADSRGPADDPQGRIAGLRGQAAGDPQAAGAFVAVAQPGLASAVGIPADTRVELRDAGTAPRVLATAARLKQVLRIPPKIGVILGPLPNPQGTMVAIEVQPIPAGHLAGVVVLSRRGKVLGTESIGSPQVKNAIWSPSGSRLAFIGAGAVGPEVTAWDIGGAVATKGFPLSTSGLVGCLWSPDATNLLCGSGFGSWVLLDGSSTGFPTQVRGRGLPLAWLDGRLGR